MQRISKYGCFIIVIVLLLCVQVSTATTRQSAQQRQFDSITNALCEKDKQISFLEERIEFLSEKQSAEVELINQSNQNIANELETSSRTISVWGYILSFIALLMGAFISIFVTKKRDQIKDISNVVANAKIAVEDVQDKMENSTEKTIKTLDDALLKLDEFQNLYSDFENHMSEIYQHLRREETLEILHRLTLVPEDIVNVGTLLLSRTLEPGDFNLVFQAFNNLMKKNSDTTKGMSHKFQRSANNYAIVFYQHFLDEAIKNDFLRDFLVSKFDYLCACAFINDMLKSTRDLKVGLRSMNAADQLQILTKYVVACMQTEYKDEKEVYEIILENLTGDEVVSLWRNSTASITGAITFSVVVKDVLLSFGTNHSLDIAEIDTYLNQETKNKY